MKESDYEKASIIYTTLGAYGQSIEDLERMIDKIQADDDDLVDFTHFIHIVLNDSNAPHSNKITAPVFEKDALEKILNFVISTMREKVVELKEQLEEL